MKEATAAYLEKAGQSLDKARRILAIGIQDEAGRQAYYAAFLAAQALIFERTGKASGSHQGGQDRIRPAGQVRSSHRA